MQALDVKIPQAVKPENLGKALKAAAANVLPGHAAGTEDASMQATGAHPTLLQAAAQTPATCRLRLRHLIPASLGVCHLLTTSCAVNFSSASAERVLVC
jgi:hypothetical protein